MIQLKKGVNLGNHFETANKNNFERTVQPWYGELIKGLGFDHVRIPVRWSSYCDFDNGMKIYPDYAAVVKKAVDEMLESGLSVVLNVHHFGQAARDPLAFEPHLRALWTQISEEYKDYPENLIFEVMNEPLKVVDPVIWNKVQNGVVKLIRETDPTRCIMIGSVDYNGIFALNDLVPPENDDNIMASFHYYFPMEFTHQGARWTPEFAGLHDVPWNGSDDEIAFIKNAISNAVEWSKKYNLPVNCGEFGALGTADLDSRVRWTAAVRKELERNDISWTYWEFNHGFGFCERDNPVVNQPLVDALLKD